MLALIDASRRKAKERGSRGGAASDPPASVEVSPRPAPGGLWDAILKARATSERQRLCTSITGASAETASDAVVSIEAPELHGTAPPSLLRSSSTTSEESGAGGTRVARSRGPADGGVADSGEDGGSDIVACVDIGAATSGGATGSDAGALHSSSETSTADTVEEAIAKTCEDQQQPQPGWQHYSFGTADESISRIGNRCACANDTRGAAVAGRPAPQLRRERRLLTRSLQKAAIGRTSFFHDWQATTHNFRRRGR